MRFVFEDFADAESGIGVSISEHDGVKLSEDHRLLEEKCADDLGWTQNELGPMKRAILFLSLHLINIRLKDTRPLV